MRLEHLVAFLLQFSWIRNSPVRLYHSGKDRNSRANTDILQFSDSNSQGERKLSYVWCLKNDHNTDQLWRPKRAVKKWNPGAINWQFRDPYRLFKRSKDFARVRKIIDKSLSMWSLASKRRITFTEFEERKNETAKPRADLDVFFARYNHGDHEPFDGKGGVVAHSGYPTEGKVHFDASERWSVSGKRGIDLTYVTLHELGHALGLRHSQQIGSVMHPLYKRTDKTVELSQEDVDRILQLYSI